MLESLTINGFRGIADLSLNDLGEVNIFVGRNGSGKTSILEATSIVANPDAPKWLATLGVWRDLPPLNSQSDDALRTCFPNLDIDEDLLFVFDSDGRQFRLKISSQIGIVPVSTQSSVSDPEPSSASPATSESLLRGVRETLYSGTMQIAQAQLELTSSGFQTKGNRTEPFKNLGAFHIHGRRATSAGETARALTELYRQKKEDLFVEAVQHVDPRISRMVPGSRGNQQIVLVDIGLPHLIPMNILGDGFCRISLIITGIVFGTSQLLVVDEIDSGLHHSVMESFWSSLLALSEHYRFQVFCSTHNEEMIYHTLSAFQDEPDKLRIFRVERDGGNNVSVQEYTYDLFRDAEKAGFDIR